MVNNGNNSDNNTINSGERKSGGLYKNLKVSVKTVNIVIGISILALVLAVAFAVSHNGFSVTFDTDGGSYIEKVRVMYGETVLQIPDPQKDGYKFNGWYLDRAKTYEWKIDTDKVTESITLYADWEEERK